MGHLVAYVVIACVVSFSPVYAFEPYPSRDVVEAMKENLKNYGEIILVHPPMSTLKVEHASEGKRTVVNFYLVGNSSRWMVDEFTPRHTVHGSYITSWEFLSFGVVILKKRMTGVQNEPEPPTQRIDPWSPGWNEAMEKSRLAWKMLCATYPCPAQN